MSPRRQPCPRRHLVGRGKASYSFAADACAASMRQPSWSSWTQVWVYRIRTMNGWPPTAPARVPRNQVTPVEPTTNACNSDSPITRLDARDASCSEPYP